MGSRTDPFPVAIALGSNLGDRAWYLRSALEALRKVLTDLRPSTFYETVPVGVGEQPMFLNAAAIGHTRLSPQDLMLALLDIERRLGRERPHPGAARVIDLDLVLYGDTVMSTASVSVPHPRFRDRLFVLDPLCELAPEWIDPVTGESLAGLRARLLPRQAG